MPKNKVILKQGNLVFTTADAIVIPVEPNEPIPEYIIDDVKTYFFVDLKPVKYQNVGKVNILEFENNRRNNLKPLFHILLPVIPRGHRLTKKHISSVMQEICTFSQASKDVRDIAITLPDLYNTQISDLDAYELMYNIFNRDSFKECALEIYIEDEKRYNQLLNDILESSSVKETLRKLGSDGWDTKLMATDFYLAQSHFNGVEVFEVFFDKNIWSPELTAENLAKMREVKVGSLIFLDYSPDRNDSLISIQAVGEVTAIAEDHLQVNWTAKNFMSAIKNRDFPDVPLYKIELPYIKRELLLLYHQEVFDEKNWDGTQWLADRFDVLQSVSHLNNDNARGIDHLDIGDDVNAFARIIALEKFTPPLAIALCGQWGSGKSFFMNQMVKVIDELAKTNPGGLFCTGVVHIHFNAWSYMDSNLWASMVSKIFSGLNSYITNDKAGNDVIKKIKEEIQTKLNLTKDEVQQLESDKKANEKDIETLESQKETIKAELDKEIKKLRDKSLKSFIEEVDKGFDISKKVEEAVQENKAAKQVKSFVKDNFPKEITSDPEYVKKELSSGYLFFLEFFRKDRIWWNLASIIGIVILIYLLRESLPGLFAFLKNVDVNLTPRFWAIMTVLGGFSTRAFKTYKHIKPLVASLWKITSGYKAEIDNARFKWEQQEKAIKIEMSIKKDAIAHIDEQLVEHEAMKHKLEFRLENTLNSEALTRFITEKSGKDGYRKQQGIIATIREDFETLTALFLGADKENEKESPSSKLDKPIKRIILYIDDLDRCSEERIVEVLEAVHLLMAFELFVVVAGIDPTWVKGALRNQRVPIEKNGNENDKGLQVASRYLEKIFQIPFHLKAANNDSIKNMVRAITGNAQTNATAATPSQSAEAPPVQPNGSGVTVSISQTNPENSDSERASTAPTRQVELPNRIEALVLEQDEINQLAEFATLLGPNPRSIKRFVNTYQIIRAHGGMEFSTRHSQLQHYMAIMFLLAINIGRFRRLKEILYTYTQSRGNEDLKLFLSAEPGSDDLRIELSQLRDTMRGVQWEPVKALELGLLEEHRPFVCRFSFD